MATYQVPVVKIQDVLEHPNADSLELALIYEDPHLQCVVEKGKFTKGELVVHIPVESIIGDKILNELDLVGKLAGKEKNRLKAVKLRGQVSQGILYRQIKPESVGQDYIVINGEKRYEGDDLVEIINVKKYNPEIPLSMSGDMDGYTKMPKFDVENVLKYSHLLQDGEEVYLTEKMHGTLQCIYFDQDEQEFYTASKGMLGRAKFKKDNKGNLYVNIMNRYLHCLNKMKHSIYFQDKSKDVVIYAEIFGQGVQDLHYGMTKGRKDLNVFEMMLFNKTTHSREFLDKEMVFDFMETYGIPHVEWRKDVYTKERLKDGSLFFDEKSKAFMHGEHIEEGVVIEPVVPRYDEEIGMKLQLKLIKEDYLLRKKGTEYQ